MTKRRQRDGTNSNGARMLLSQERRVALGDLLHAVNILQDHIRHDPRARSAYERFMAFAVIDQAAAAILKVREHFDIKEG